MSRRMILVGLLLAVFMAESPCATAALASSPSPSSPHSTSIVIVAPPTTVVGVPCCVFVTLPTPSDEFSYSVDVLGKAVESTVTKVSQGGFILCFIAPPGSSGQSVTVTVSAGGQSSSTSVSVL
jgi:hypothetical protein